MRGIPKTYDAYSGIVTGHSGISQKSVTFARIRRTPARRLRLAQTIDDYEALLPWNIELGAL